MAIANSNAKSSKWLCQDNLTFEGNVIDDITSQFGLHQEIKKLTNIFYTSSSCNDPIFTSLFNSLLDSGFKSSLQPNCHNQIVYAKFNLEITFLLPYLQEKMLTGYSKMTSPG